MEGVKAIRKPDRKAGDPVEIRNEHLLDAGL
jgi:hypothetical protein